MDIQSKQLIEKYSQWGSAREALIKWENVHCLKVNLSYDEKIEESILRNAAKEEKNKLEHDKQNPPIRYGYLQDYVDKMKSDRSAAQDEKHIDLYEKTLADNPRSLVIFSIDFPYDITTRKTVYPSTFTIPSRYQGVPVVAFHGQLAEYKWSEYADWFEPNDTLEELTVQEGIIMIGTSAFHECVSLRSVSLPGSLKIISREAFSNCKRLSTIVLPDSIEVIETGAFEYCEQIKSIVIPSKLNKIETACFSGSGLERVSIPGNIISIGHSAFAGCRNLKSVNISEGVRAIEDFAFDECYDLSRIVFPKSLTDISEKIFQDRYASLSDQREELKSVEPTIYCYKGTDGYFFGMDHHMKVELLD